MPILERDPWRFQYFEKAFCPKDVIIPTDDPDCWALFPEHHWVYDKLRVASSQGLECAPHGVPPLRYPVFSKPITNLKGMGVGSLALLSADDMQRHYQPGHMWMTLLEGEHVSTDCAVVAGQVKWLRHATGLTGSGGTFISWTIAAAAQPALADYLGAWVAKHMRSYTGMMNFETIGDRIIEVHLRFADQWCDLYGSGWVQALVGLYAHKQWVFDDGGRVDGFSIPLFARHGFAFKHPSKAQQAEIRAMEGMASLQITFHESKESADHPMPPGGFRLAVINATDLTAGLKARDRLAAAFPAESLFRGNEAVSDGAEIPFKITQRGF